MIRWRRLIPLVVAVACGFSACAPNPLLVRRSANDPPLPAGRIAPILFISSSPDTSSGSGNAKGAPAAAAAPAPASGPSVRIALSNPSATQVADIEKALDKSSSDKIASSDFTTLKRTIILTIAKGAYRPADRLVNVAVEISPTNFIFSDVMNYTTDYTNVDIGSLNLTQSNSTSASISPTFGGSLVGTGAFGVTTGNTLVEAADVSVRPEILNVNLAGSNLIVYREADRGSDLAGNTLINVAVHATSGTGAKPSVFPFEFPLVATAVTLASKDGSDLPPQFASNAADKVSIKAAVQPRLIAQDLRANVRFTYVQRHVVFGQDTYAEYRQGVAFETGQCIVSGAIIVPAADLYTPLYVIAVDAPNGKTVSLWDNLTDVKTSRTLFFADYLMADQMAFWMMRQKAAQIGSRRLTLGDNGSLEAKNYPHLHVMPKDMRPPEPPPSDCVPVPLSGPVPVISAAD